MFGPMVTELTTLTGMMVYICIIFNKLYYFQLKMVIELTKQSETIVCNDFFV